MTQNPHPGPLPKGEGGRTFGPRTLSVQQVSDATGYSYAEVFLWWTKRTPVCPHSMSVRKGKPSPSFNLEEVFAWRDLCAMPRVNPSIRPTAAQKKRAELLTKGQLPAVASSSDAPRADHHPGPLPLGEEATPSGALFDARGDSEDRPGDEIGDEKSTADMLASLRRTAARAIDDIDAKLREALAGTEGNALSVDGMQRLTQAFKQLSTELRQLDDARFVEQRRLAQWVPKSEAAAIVEELAGVFVSSLDALRADLTQRVSSALADLIAPEAHDRAAQAVAAGVADGVAALRSRLETQARASGASVTEAAQNAAPKVKEAA